mgnify:CR=1 FL=1
MTPDNFLNTLMQELSFSTYNTKPKYESTNYQRSSFKIFEEDNNIIFKCLAPGMSKENIDITFDKKSLIVKSDNKRFDKDFKSVLNEKINLLKSIDSDNSYATLNEGILTVTMPVCGKDVSKKISFR